MAKELKRIDITHRPELLQIVGQLRDSNEPLLLQEGNEDVAIVRPLRRPRRTRVPRGKPFTMDDPLWNLVGAGASGLGDVSQNKHKYLADAYADLHE